LTNLDFIVDTETIPEGKKKRKSDEGPHSIGGGLPGGRPERKKGVKCDPEKRKKGGRYGEKQIAQERCGKIEQETKRDHARSREEETRRNLNRGRGAKGRKGREGRG